jgi:putative oxidoreductase
MASIAAIIGRIFLAVIFIVSGVTKLMTVSATDTMITGAGLPGGLAIPIGVFELVAGVCLAIGLMTRLASILLAVFVLVATLFFHMELTDPTQQAMALKNLAIAGGLLLVFAHSQLWYGWDRITRERRGEVATHEAEERAREAELRAARAEGAATAHGDGAVVEDRPRRRKWF